MHYRIGKKEGNKRDLAKVHSFSQEDIKLFEDFFAYWLEQRKGVEKDPIPISIFSNRKLAPLEIIVKYLRENLEMSYGRIASLLNRKPGPIGVTYRNSRKKYPARLHVISTEILIPLSIFKESKFTVFETLVWYLKDSLNFKFTKIANLLNRNYRTVWTVYRRAKIKR